MQAASKIPYIKLHHIYTKTLQRYAYIITIWLFYTMSAVYKTLVWFPDAGSLKTETYDIQYDM